MKYQEKFWYPDSEERLHRDHSALWTLDHFILPHLHATKYCVQAGGAVGAWPIEFAKTFDEVYTFEPNPVLWKCLQRNLSIYPSENVIAHHAGLWKESGGYCDMVDTQSENMGAWHIKLSDDESLPPVVAIDDLDLPGCDLLQLDIEGAEVAAIEGAKRTIMEYLPVIVVESKPVTLGNFNKTCEQLYSAVARLRYKKVQTFSRDEMWIPIV